MKRILILLLAVWLLTSPAVRGEEGIPDQWFTFLLMCNEGMVNDGGDVGNTLMVISMNPGEGIIRQLMFTWDTFIDYPGFDLPQLLDRPFRVGGPQETVRLFNQVFEQNIPAFLSINYLNLASLIDAYGGVSVDVTRAERNALNGMVASKKEHAKSTLGALALDDNLFDALLNSYALMDYGPGTHLTGLQAVAYGWLQYDSVYNCCVREVHVIAALFTQVSQVVRQRVAFTMDGDPMPELNGRRLINIGHMTGQDVDFLMEILSPIFEKSYHNLTRDQIEDITLTVVRAGYQAQWMGVDMFDAIAFQVLPLEHGQAYHQIAGVAGHFIDYKANILAINHFLYGQDVSPLLGQ